MAVILYTGQKNRSKVGKNYFFSKYCLDIDITTEHIQIIEVDKSIEPGIHSDISYNNYSLPAFDIPVEINENGKIIARALNGEKSYPCVVDTGTNFYFGFDVFHYIGVCLSGEIELIWKQGEGREKFSGIPFADIYSDLLFRALSLSIRRSGLPLVYKSFWPEGRSFAVCLTHDIDEVRKTYQWISYPLRKIRKKDLTGLMNQLRSFKKRLSGFEPFWMFPQLQKMETDLGVRSSLYFLHETGKVQVFSPATWRHLGRRYSPNDPKLSVLIKLMYERGWDIGLHGSFYSFDNPDLLIREKKELEEVLLSDVPGIRQHNLNLKIPDTWIYQSRAGFSYDSTLGFNDIIGFRWGVCFPFLTYDQSTDNFIPLLEIPLVIQEIALFRSMDYCSHSLRIEEEVEKMRGVLTLLWHHSVLNEFEFPGWGDFYEQIIRRCIDKNAWVTHAAEISQWWRERGSEMKYSWNNNTLIISSNPNTNNYFELELPVNKKIIRMEGCITIRENENHVSIKGEKNSNSHIIIEMGDSSR